MEISGPADSMRDRGAPKRAAQERALRTRRKIAEGAIQVLAARGVSGLTHRAVAKEAGVSLAATTYHFETKQDILAETSRMLMEGYLEAFRRLERRVRAGEETAIRSMDDLVERVVGNALGRERTRSLAWCELMLHGGRHADGRALAQRWYSELDAIWDEIADILPSRSPLRPGAAIDIVVGFSILLHPLMLEAGTVSDLLHGTIALDQLKEAGRDVEPGTPSLDTLRPRQIETRGRLIEAAIEVLVAEGTAAVSHAAVAERAGMVRSGPGYYFLTIEGLLRAAQTALFERAKSRYRAGIGATTATKIDAARLADLTTTIFFRELLEFARENVGYYSVWMSAAQNAQLRPTVRSALLDQHHAWARRLKTVHHGAVPHAAPLRLQALFVGKLIRGIAGQPDNMDLSRSREDFAAAIGEAMALSNR